MLFRSGRATRRWVQAVAASTAIAVLALASSAIVLARTGRATDEFQDPSWTSLPARSPFNRLPSCRLDQFSYTCYRAISGSSQPADPFNPESYLNSAYWPSEQRPDIEQYAMARYGYDYENCSRNTVHYCFYVDAKKAGYPISHVPKAGDLAVFPVQCARPGPTTAVKPNCAHDSNSFWYVMYVQRVLPGGAYIGSGGGATDSNLNAIDSGLIEQEVSKHSDRYTYFIGLMPKRRQLAPPKHRILEPTTRVRFRAYPTTDDPALRVRFWLNRKAPSVQVKLGEQYGPTSPVKLVNVPAGSHYVSLKLSSDERKQFFKHHFIYVYYVVTIGSSRYESPTVTITSNEQTSRGVGGPAG